MANRLQNKSAIVTGAASGIGRASAERFAREGARALSSLAFLIEFSARPGANIDRVRVLKSFKKLLARLLRLFAVYVEGFSGYDASNFFAVGGNDKGLALLNVMEN